MLPESPLKDIGVGSSTTLDIEGLERPVNIIADIGSYEYRVPVLNAETPIQFLTDSDDLMTAQSWVDVNTGSDIPWTASTDADWIYLGATGSAQVTTGVVESYLIVRVDPSKVSVGEYHTVVYINSPSAESASIDVYLIKVDEVKKLFLPSIIR